MWLTFIWPLTCLLIIKNLFLTRHTSFVNSQTVSPIPIPDSEFEQVIAERYLFAPFANESSAWTVLSNVSYAWQAASLPRYHSQAAVGVWILFQSITETYNTRVRTLHMSWMSLSTNGTMVIFSEIDVKSNTSLLVTSHNEDTALKYTAALISPDSVQFILCNRSDASLCKVIQMIAFPSALVNTTKITGGIFVEDLGARGWLYFAADSGLHGLDLSTFIIHPFLNEINVSVSSLAWSSKRQTIFAGTNTKLWIHSYGIGNEGWRFEHVTGLIDAPITSLVYSEVQDKLWIGQSSGITLLSPIIMSTGRLHWFFSRLAGQISNPGSDIGHLPFLNITSLSVSQSMLPDGRVWLGAVRGVMRYDSNSSDINAWRVFNSARYMPNRESLVHVSSLSVLSRHSDASPNLGSGAVAITNKGLAILRFEMWTLGQKANHFQMLVDQPGRHDKNGFVSDCSMSSWGDSRTCIKESDDNDGMWTSMYLASQIFRYVVTQDARVKAQAWKHFEAMELLNKVTGIPGYPARSYAKRTDFLSKIPWYPSPVYPDLQFEGDTSSDEICGHDRYQEDRGINSLQILAYLLQAYGYSGDERFLDGANLLIESYQYSVNLINQKMVAVCASDLFYALPAFNYDLMAYLSYFNLVHAFHTIASSASLSTVQKARAQSLIDDLWEYMEIGLDLSHNYKKMEKTPFFNFIYCYASGQVNRTRNTSNKRHGLTMRTSQHDCNSLSNDGVWHMQRWPLELINWPQFNSDRLDVQINVPAQCYQPIKSLMMLPADERSTKNLVRGVYDLDDGDGFVETDPTNFLLGYWGMRYFNLLQ
ncbi:unnamed protein product [Adineta steineri]|uniref:Uncharacterized protein n=1 Tax=Adineta steineri TaxID=433720 RepID=A0A819KJL8_9BILA|nr:unnamed protein product [Adineta steineri]CAF3948138.1 unnamed protein product [Adineta steineri]